MSSDRETIELVGGYWFELDEFFGDESYSLCYTSKNGVVQTIAEDVAADEARAFAAAHNRPATPLPEITALVDCATRLCSALEDDYFEGCGRAIVVGRELSPLVGAAKLVLEASTAASRAPVGLVDGELANIMLDVAAFLGADPAQPRPFGIASALPRQRAILWRDLIREEQRELSDAIGQEDIVQIAHEAVDLIYVTAGMMVESGIPFQAVWREVHAANMRKVDPVTGAVRHREDGKILKPEGWKKADVAAALASSTQPDGQYARDHYMVPEGYAADCWQDLIEKTDRTSPEDYPDYALITREELVDYIAAAPKPTTQAGDASGGADVAETGAVRALRALLRGKTRRVEAATTALGLLPTAEAEEIAAAIRALSPQSALLGREEQRLNEEVVKLCDSVIGDAYLGKTEETELAEKIKRAFYSRAAPQPPTDKAGAAVGGREDAGRVPDGWKLVPAEPTQEMLNAGDANRFINDRHQGMPVHASKALAKKLFLAMLAAAPKATTPAEDAAGGQDGS